MMRWSKGKPLEIRDVVARRAITEAGAPNRKILVLLGKPRRFSSQEWRCPILIRGLEKDPIADSAPGVDGFQALLLGVECIRWHLKESGRRFAWLGDSELFGAGIPRQVPTGFGREFDERIERAIERESRRARKFRAPILRRMFRKGLKESVRRDKPSVAPRSQTTKIGNTRKRNR
jgi:Domain of unknown function (DUF6968)